MSARPAGWLGAEFNEILQLMPIEAKRRLVAWLQHFPPVGSEEWAEMRAELAMMMRRPDAADAAAAAGAADAGPLPTLPDRHGWPTP